MRVLVTGGAGYVGSVLVGHLLREGRHVTVLDTFANGPTLAHLVGDARLKIVRGDARDARAVRPLLRAADALLPLAAVVGAPACDTDPVGAQTTNYEAVQLIVDEAAHDQVIIYPNTNSGYGRCAPGEECTEDMPLNPVSLYGRTKVEAEAAVLGRENSVALRLATVFGFSPRMRLDLLVNDFVWRAVTDRAVVLFEAHHRRCYVHVGDVARAFDHALLHFGAMRGRPYNVGLSDSNLTKAELCGRIAAHVPGFTWLEAPVGKDPDQRDYAVSNARVEAAGWRPAHSLDAGIAELAGGYRMMRRFAHGNA